MPIAAAIADTVARVADTLAHGSLADTVRESAEGPMVFREFLERWHDFFVLTGTAAVTLAGLLFIALSLHMEVLVQPRFGGMLLVARSALVSFVMVLIVSIVMLPPALPVRPTGTILMIFAALFALQTIREYRGADVHDHADFSRRTVRRRVLMPLFGYGLVGTVGWGLFTRNYPLTYQMIGAMIMLLVNAAYASWDLLVRVSRVKATNRREPPPVD